eukprot:scaffold569_cov408-Prasinococcus_capsulatus_cf.AAC.60
MMLLMMRSRPMAADRRMRAAARVPRPPAWSSSRARGKLSRRARCRSAGLGPRVPASGSNPVVVVLVISVCIALAASAPAGPGPPARTAPDAGMHGRIPSAHHPGAAMPPGCWRRAGEGRRVALELPRLSAAAAVTAAPRPSSSGETRAASAPGLRARLALHGRHAGPPTRRPGPSCRWLIGPLAPVVRVSFELPDASLRSDRVGRLCKPTAAAAAAHNFGMHAAAWVRGLQ